MKRIPYGKEDWSGEGKSRDWISMLYTYVKRQSIELGGHGEGDIGITELNHGPNCTIGRLSLSAEGKNVALRLQKAAGCHLNPDGIERDSLSHEGDEVELALVNGREGGSSDLQSFCQHFKGQAVRKPENPLP
jgi:hypothetical protein